MELTFQCSKCDRELESKLEPTGYSEQVIINIEPCTYCLQELEEDKEEEKEEALEELEIKKDEEISKMQDTIDDLRETLERAGIDD